MQVDWTPLRSALREARGQGRALRFWWRDDDAIAPTPALERLEGIAQAANVPVHIAVIPATATPELAEVSIASKVLVPVVHGWAHADTSAPEAKKSEFERNRSEAAGETALGLARMQKLFGAALVPMFVPPWNRISEGLVAQLAAQGYRGLSTFGPRGVEILHGLHLVNTHVDPIFWRGNRGLADTSWLIETAAAHLRSGSSEPLGLLTHHLVHTDDIWAFSARFIAEMQDGGALPFDLKSALKN
jgi:predicted deacetylase